MTFPTPDLDARRSEREDMVRLQLERRGITDPRVLGAMRQVPRELFVSADVRPHAYADRALPIGSGQTISQPFMVAVMTQALGAGPGAHLLEVGTGSGYQAAILAHMAGDVISIERHAELAAVAEARLAALGCRNVRVVVGDGTEGYAGGAPYDGILVTAGAPHVPEALRAQLADGGRLVIPVGTSHYQELLIVTRSGDRFEEARGEGCVFVPLVGRHGWREP